jgi:hypothetical protein
MKDASVEVRVLEPEDVTGLAACLRRCYGDGYPKRVLYDDRATARLVARGELRGVVALRDGHLVGHIGFTAPNRYASVVEAGTTIVDPEVRGAGVMQALSAELFRMLRRDDVDGFVHFPTTAHQVMQRASVRSGGVETGILLAYIPASTRDAALGSATAGRVAVTVVHQQIASETPSRPCIVPERYAAVIESMVARSPLVRAVVVDHLAARGDTVLSSSMDRVRRLGRVRIEHVGEDVGDALAHAIAVLVDDAVELIHVDIPLDGPGVDATVDALRRRAFVFGAWLPGWDRGDVLRMQRLAELSQAERRPDLASAEARALLQLIDDELDHSTPTVM